MAIYDYGATPATAVAAFLSQFKVAASGNITYISGSNTFHVRWLHAALQKIAWDFAVSGDDELNLSKPNPSKAEALSTIITLYDYTTDFSVRYNITDAVAEYLFGGSVNQQNASAQTERYSGLKVLGSVPGATYLQILQNHTVLTSHWGTGKNQTDGSTLLRVLIKTIVAGTEVDGSRVNVKASKWGDTYAIWQTTLGLGEAVAAINTASDPQNNTLLATVQAYSIAKSEGYKLLNIDGAGNKPFLGEWNYGAYNKKALYEFLKSLLTYGTSQTLYGMDGDLWTGRIYNCVVTTPRSGTWVQNETLTWSGGAGQLLAVDTVTGGSTVRLILHLNTGVPPSAAATITGNGGAIGTVSGTPTSISSNPGHLGQFTGSSWIGAFGIGFNAGQLNSTDSVMDLDGNAVSPLNWVSCTVNVECEAGDDPHVYLAKKHATLNRPDEAQMTAASGNSSGLGTFTVSGAIPADTPTTGAVLVKATGQPTAVALYYTSWTGSVFTLSGTLPYAITAGDATWPAFLYESAAGGGTTKTATASLVYSGDRALVGWVRHGAPGAPDKPVPLATTLTSSGVNLTVVIENE
jgi:hypothetical protein